MILIPERPNPLCVYSSRIDIKDDPSETVYGFHDSLGNSLLAEVIPMDDNRQIACAIAVGLLQASRDELYSRREGQ